MVWFRNQEIIKSRVKLAFSVALTVVAIHCAIKYSKECTQGILSGLAFCATVLIPSLFVFMVIASYSANSKAAEVVGTLFKIPTQKCLKLPKECATALLMSLIGGYPVGAKCTATLYKSGAINKSQAQKLALIAVCSGPGFMLNYIGQALLNNRQAGNILMISQLIAFLLVALICGVTIKVKDENVITKKHKATVSLVEAVSSGCTATINMCAMVILFSALISVCDSILKDYPTLCDLVTLTLEVTTACNRLSHSYPLYVISFATGFGGLSVHFQIFSILKDVGINKALFFFIRIIQGITSAVVTYILVILFPAAVQVFSTVESTKATVASSVWGCGALMLTAVCFLNSISYIKLQRR